MSASNFDQSDLPNIPGYRVSVDLRNKFHKTHLFDICNGIAVTDIERTQAPITPKDLENQIVCKTQKDVVGADNSNAKTGVSSMSTLPRWVVFDGKVLRFYAYFTESVFNSAIEKQRVRKCVIYYFLTDDNIMIEEVKTENSGIPQSKFLKRQRVPTRDGNGWLSKADFAVGSTISVYTRAFNIIDADGATRDYFRTDLNVTLAAAEAYPKDDYVRYLEKRDEFAQNAQQLQQTSKSQRLANSKYLANDGKVLRFNGIWREKNVAETVVRRYVLLYYMADDTIQVLQYESGASKNDSNKGKQKREDKLSCVLKRDLLPKKYIPAGVTIGIKHDKTAPHNNCYNHGDLRIGTYVNVYGRQVLLTSCDPFTQQFYESAHGLKAADFVPIAIESDEDAKLKQQQEQQRATKVQPLVPKAPPKDYNKLNKYDGCVLRFLAKLNESATQIENHQRRFVIEFFLVDDTIKIYERPLRNSGFLSGKFLERTKVRNYGREKQPWFHAEDFYVGATITVNGFKFDLLETDAQTLGIMNNNNEIFTRETPEQILKALADKLWDRSINQTKTFRFVDQDKDRYISPQELKALCATYGWNLNPNQLTALFRYFDVNDDGDIEIAEFFNALNKYKLQKHIYPSEKERVMALEQKEQ